MASLQNEQFRDFSLENDMQKFYHKSYTYFRFQFKLFEFHTLIHFWIETFILRVFQLYQCAPSSVETIPDIYLEPAAFLIREI